MKVLTTSTLAVIFCGLSMGAVGDPDEPRVFQARSVVNADTEAKVGAAWLKRSINRVDGRIMTTVDYAGIPYTAWWVVFNNPAGCLAECGPDDLAVDGGAAADVAIFYASGAISTPDGEMSAEGDLTGVINFDISAIGGEGAGIGSQVPPPPAMNAPPWNRVLKMDNARCAEIHLDINVHADPPMPVNWVGELTFPRPPGNTEAFAVFKPRADCKDELDKIAAEEALAELFSSIFSAN
jgi:hypothetical protein